MRTLFGRAFFALLVCSALSSNSFGAQFLYEGFDYPVTDPATFLNGVTHAASGNQWLKPMNPSAEYSKIASGNVGYDGFPEPTGNSALVPRATPGTGENRLTIPGQPYARANGGSYFFSFTMQMSTWVNFAQDVGDLGAKNESGRRGGFLAGFFGAPASTTTSMSLGQSFAAPVYIRRQVDYNLIGSDGSAGAQTGRYEIGVQKRATPIGLFDSTLQNSRGVVYDEEHSFEVGQTVLIVGEYKFVDTEANGSADIARLWINPTPGDFAAEATPTIVDDSVDSLNMAGTLPIASFHLRNDTNTPGDVLFDELRIGSAFADVLPAAPTGLAGDFNDDDVVDGADFLAWQRGESPVPLSSVDLQTWKEHFGESGVPMPAIAAVPEPATLQLAAAATLAILVRVRRRAGK